MRPIARHLVLIALLALAGAAPARAEEAPYDKQLVRLAEVLGSIHFLRGLCGEKDGAWRSAMQTLLEAEEPSPDRRAKLVAGFNHGYRSFAAVYTTCTAQAVEAIERYMAEGATLSEEIALRYGN